MIALLQNLNRRLFRLERMAAGALFLGMILLMFLSVAHRVFSREEGRLSLLLLKVLQNLGLQIAPGTVHGPLSLLLNVVLCWLFALLAMRTLRREPALTWPQSLVRATLVTLGLTGAIALLLFALPNGLVWGPALALGLMLWLGFLGASMATYEQKHLSLEMGEKLWPPRVQPYVKGLAAIVTGILCALLGILAFSSLRLHYQTWLANPLTGQLLPTEIPKWTIFLVLPYTFVVMSLRFLGQGVQFLQGKAEDKP